MVLYNNHNGSTGGGEMATITLKNIPNSLHAKLKKLAKAHRRSLNNELLACLEEVQVQSKLEPDAILRRARTLRKGIKGNLTEQQLKTFKEFGRK